MIRQTNPARFTAVAPHKAELTEPNPSGVGGPVDVRVASASSGGGARPVTDFAQRARGELAEIWARIQDVDPENAPEDRSKLLGWYSERSMHLLLRDGLSPLTEDWLTSVEAGGDPAEFGQRIAQPGVDALRAMDIDAFETVVCDLRRLQSTQALLEPAGDYYLAARSRGAVPELGTSLGFRKALQRATTELGDAFELELANVIGRIDRAHAELAQRESTPVSRTQIERLSQSRTELEETLGKLSGPNALPPEDLLIELHCAAIPLRSASGALEKLDGDFAPLLTRLESSKARSLVASERGPLAAGLTLSLENGDQLLLLGMILDDRPVVVLSGLEQDAEHAAVPASIAPRIRAALSKARSVAQAGPEQRTIELLDFLLERADLFRR